MSAEPIAPLVGAPDITPEPFRRDGLGYVYEPQRSQVRLAVDFLARSRDELQGEIVVEMRTGAHLHQARFNLSSTTARDRLVAHLNKRTNDDRPPDQAIPWGSLLEVFCREVLRAERKGEPVQKIGGLTFPDDPPDLIQTILPAGMATQLFAPGKTGKGWIAMGAAVAVQTGSGLAGLRARLGRALYLDWEDNARIASLRVDMVARGMGFRDPVQIDYRSCREALRHAVNELARYVNGEGITFVIVDSAQRAIGAQGDFSTYESGAQWFFEGCRLLGENLTLLIIDHVDKSTVKGDGKGQGVAYGSIMKTNWVRNVWELKKDQQPGQKVSRLGLYHNYTNHTEVHPPIGIRLDFQTPGEVHFIPDAIEDSDGLSASLPLADRIARALRDGPMQLKDIAEHADASQQSAAVTMSRDPSRFRKTGPGRYELINQLRIVESPETAFADDDLPFFPST